MYLLSVYHDDSNNVHWKILLEQVCVGLVLKILVVCFTIGDLLAVIQPT